MKTTAIIILLIVVLGIGALALNKKKTESPTEGSKSGDAESKKAEEIKNRQPLTNIKLGENKTYTSGTQTQPAAVAAQESKSFAQKAKEAVESAKAQGLIPETKSFAEKARQMVQQAKEQGLIKPTVISDPVIESPQKKGELKSTQLVDAPVLIAKQPEVQKLGKPQPVNVGKKKSSGTNLSQELDARSFQIAYYFGLN